MNARSSMRRGVDLLFKPERVEAALWRAHKESKGVETGARLFDHYRPFAAQLARAQFAHRKVGNFEREDLEQLAYEGLLQTIERFDSERSVPFEAFARIRINGHIANGLAQTSEAAAQSRHRQRSERERLKSLRPTREAAADPVAALSALSAAIALGLMLDMGAVSNIEEIPDPAPSAYESLAWNELHAKVHELIDNLPERENFVIRQHYRNGVSFQQIAVLMGLTKGRVSQIHRSGLERLRSLLAKWR